MCNEDIEQTETNSDNNQNDYAPDIPERDTSTYQERGITEEDLVEKE